MNAVKATQLHMQTKKHTWWTESCSAYQTDTFIRFMFFVTSTIIHRALHHK